MTLKIQQKHLEVSNDSVGHIELVGIMYKASVMDAWNANDLTFEAVT